MLHLPFALTALLLVVCAFGCKKNSPADEEPGQISQSEEQREAMLERLAVAIGQDFRTNDDEGIASFLHDVQQSGALVGMSRAELEAALGPPSEPWPNMQLGENELVWQIGTVPDGVHAGPPQLVFAFDEDDLVASVQFFGSQ